MHSISDSVYKPSCSEHARYEHGDDYAVMTVACVDMHSTAVIDDRDLLQDRSQDKDDVNYARDAGCIDMT